MKCPLCVDNRCTRLCKEQPAEEKSKKDKTKGKKKDKMKGKKKGKHKDKKRSKK